MTRSATNAPGMKFYLAVLAAVVTYVLNQEVLDLKPWIEICFNAIAVALAVYTGLPQPTTTHRASSTRA